MSKNDLKISDAYLSALNEAKHLIVHSQEKFLRSANRISMGIRWRPYPLFKLRKLKTF